MQLKQALIALGATLLPTLALGAGTSGSGTIQSLEVGRNGGQNERNGTIIGSVIAHGGDR